MRFYQIGSHESRQKPSSSELIIFHVHFRCLSGPARDPRQTAFKFNMNLCAFDSELERTRAKNRKARCRTQVEPTKGPLEANKATPQEILDRPREVNAFFINHYGLRPFVAFNHRKIFVSFFSSPKKNAEKRNERASNSMILKTTSMHTSIAAFFRVFFFLSFNSDHKKRTQNFSCLVITNATHTDTNSILQSVRRLM